MRVTAEVVKHSTRIQICRIIHSYPTLTPGHTSPSDWFNLWKLAQSEPILFLCEPLGNGPLINALVIKQNVTTCPGYCYKTAVTVWRKHLLLQHH